MSAERAAAGRATKARLWWSQLSFTTDRPAIRLASLTGLGMVIGAGESASILLLVALAAGSRRSRHSFVAVFPSSTWVLAGVTVVAVAVLAVLHFASARLTARVGADSLRRLRRELVAAYLATSWTAQSAEHAGQLQELVMGNAWQVAFGTEQAANGVAAALSLAVVIVVAVVVNPWSAVGVVVVGVMVLGVVRPSRAYLRRLARRSASASATLALGVSETASMARELQAFGVSDAAAEGLGRGIDATAEDLAASRFASQAIPNLSRDLTIAVLVVGLAGVAASGSSSLARIGASVVLLLRGLGQAQMVSNVSHQLAERSANLDRILTHLGRWRSQGAPRGRRRCPPQPAVAFEGVWYRYPAPAFAGGILGGDESARPAPGGRVPERPALAGVSFRLEFGEQVGVMGRTGAGKSTLAGLLLGVLAAERGRVLVGGVPLGDLDPAEWHRRSAWVPQDPRLVSGTVADNIRFFRPEVDRGAIERAAVAAGLGPELSVWPEGLDRPVGPGGAALSGGQRQRVTLARALAGSPDLIVLDEPTSALDAPTEAAISASLADLRGRVTVVIIAHRAALLESCDRVLNLDQGRLIGVQRAPAVRT